MTSSSLATSTRALLGTQKSGDQTSESGHRGDVPPQVLKVAQRGRRRGRGAQDHDEYGHTECAPHLAGSVSGCERNERANSSAGRFCYGMHFICLRCVMQLTSIGVWNEKALPRWTVRWPSAKKWWASGGACSLSATPLWAC